MKNGKTIYMLAAGTAAIALGAAAGAASAAVFPSRLLSATVTIVDQQSALQDDTGAPILDPDSGLPETLDDTSVNLDVLFVGDILAATGGGGGVAPQATMANGSLAIFIEPAGFCAAQQRVANTVPAPLLTRALRPIQIPLAELVKGGGFPTTYQFEGLTDVLPDRSAAAAQVLGAPAATFESQGSFQFDGDPWANLLIVSTGLGGELKLDGITDLSGLLGPPKLKVDVAIVLRPGSILNSDVKAPAPVPTTFPLCITVPAAVQVRQLAPTDVSQF